MSVVAHEKVVIAENRPGAGSRAGVRDQVKAAPQTATDTARPDISWRADVCNPQGTLLGRRSIERSYCVASADRLKTLA